MGPYILGNGPHALGYGPQSLSYYGEAGRGHSLINLGLIGISHRPHILGNSDSFKRSSKETLESSEKGEDDIDTFKKEAAKIIGKL